MGPARGSSILSDSVKIGVAGAGVFGAYHAAKFASHPSAVLSAIFDPDSDRSEALAAEYGAQASRDLDDFLQSVDAVVVTAPATSHFELVDRALRAGRHVFVEKPIALDVDQANDLINRAEEMGLILQVGHQERYVFDAVGLLARDKAPLKIDCVRCGPTSGRCEDVSVVFDLMVHDIDLVRQLTKSEIGSVAAEGAAGEVTADLTLANGAVVTMKASRLAETRDRRMSLVYDDGFIEFDFINRTVENSTPAMLNEVFDCKDAPPALKDPLAYGADAFLQSIINDAPLRVSGKDGRDAVAWAVRIEEAAGLALRESETMERMLA